MSVRTVAVADTSFLLREHGAGDATPVLLLHGVPETSTCWRDVAPRLAEGRRVLAPDLPGLGGSTYSGPYDVASLVEQVAALVEAEVGGSPVDVVGHDWGGVVGLGLTGARPELVRRLVVANAPYREVPRRALHVPFFALPVAPEVLFRLGGRRVVDAMINLGWKSPTPLDPEARAEYQAAYADPAKVDAMLGYYRAAARPRVAAAVRREPVSALPPAAAEKMMVLWGAADPALTLADAEAVVRDLGPDCVMVSVPGAGHFVVEEAPDIVAAVLVDFLAEPGAKVVEQAAAPTVDQAGPAQPARKRAAARKPAAKKAAGTKAAGTKAAGTKAASSGRRQPPEGPPFSGTS